MSSVKSPAQVTGRVPKVKLNKERQVIDDEPYRQYMEDYREDLIDGMVYMLGDYPRED